MEEMRKVHETEAKAQLPDLIGDVEKGEFIAITRNGKDVAALAPCDDAERERRRQVVESFLESRRKRGKTNISIEEFLAWRHEGHRF